MRPLHYHVTESDPRGERAELGEELTAAEAVSRFEQAVADAQATFAGGERHAAANTPATEKPEALHEVSSAQGIVWAVRVTPCRTDHSPPPVAAVRADDNNEAGPDVQALEARIAALT